MSSTPAPDATPTRAGRSAWVVARRAVPAWLVVAGLVFTLIASRFVGPSFDEEARLNAVKRGTDLWRAVVSSGPGALFDDTAERIYREIAPAGAAPALLSGWLGEVLNRAGLVDRLTGARLGWLSITSLSPAALYVIVRRSQGPRVAALSAALLLAVPRWIHGAAAGREAVVVTSLWLVLLAFYIEYVARSAPRPRPGLPGGLAASPRSRLWILCGFGAFLGVAIAFHFAALWVLLLVVPHFLGVRGRRAVVELRGGRLPLPALFLPALVLAPVFFVLLAPPLWRGGSNAVDWMLSGLSPVVEPVLYGRPIVAPGDVPAVYAAHWLVATTPAWLSLVSMGGGVVLLLEAREARRRLRPGDPVRLGLLCALALASVVLFGPLLTPNVLLRFPPRAEFALPFLVVLAAVALDRLTTRVVGKELAARVLAPLAVLAVAMAAAGLPTASASFSTLVGGTEGALARQVWTVGDGSEVAGLARSIDALGVPQLSVEAHEIPRAVWTTLNQANRMKTRVDTARQSSYRVTRGPVPGALGTVERDKAVLWSLSRR